MERHLDTAAWVVLLLTVVYIGGHFVVATANGWDGIIDYGELSGESTASDIELNTGTRETVEDIGLFIPGGEIQVTDSEGTVQNVEYARFVPHLINLVKRQSAEIETLKTKVAALESA